MCGICGVIRLDDAPVTIGTLKVMNERMVSRGPDDEGYYVSKNFGMAMRRLSVIDLHTGKQPISNTQETVIVVMNGEIYNYIELRSELEKKGHIFRTNSDTEVLVHLYEEHGTDAVRFLNGMFAFALWDSDKKRLWLVRDRIGIKPLVFFKNDKLFAFASTMDALVTLPEIKSEVDEDSLLLYFSLAYVPTPRTIWKGVRKMEPGHWMILDGGKIHTHRYWSMHGQVVSGKSEKDLIEESRRILDNSIHLHSRSDVPVGTFLSGGLDSSAVTSLFAQESNQKVHTFSIDFEGKVQNEGRYAKQVSDRYSTTHHSYVLSPKVAVAELNELLPRLDEPMADSAIIPSYFLSKCARKHGIKVVLCGAGGDELYGGYARHYRRPRDYFVGALPFISVRFWQRLCSIHVMLTHYGCLTWDKGVAFGNGTSGVNIGDLSSVFSNPDSWVRTLELTKMQLSGISREEDQIGFEYSRMITDLNNYLVDNVLSLTDKSSMASSVEARVPLLDHRLIELAFTLPSISNVNKNFKNAKTTLKSAVADVVPREILERKKVGFNAPLSHWVTDESLPIGERIKNPRTSVIRNLFDKDRLRNLWISPRSRQRSVETLFMVYVMDSWLESKGIS